MHDIPLYDANVAIGRPAHPFFASWLDADCLIAEMDRFGIQRALVSHVWGLEISTVVGNTAVAEATRSQDRLLPVWSVEPNCEEEGRSAQDQIREAIGAGAGAVRLDAWPARSIMQENVDPRDFKLHPAVVGSLCRDLEAAGLPLLVDMNQTDWPEIYGLCEQYPDLAIVLLNMRFTHQRSLYAGLGTYSNLHFEISGYHVHRGLEDLHETFGAQQILFGTRMAEYTGASSVSMLLYADIPAEAKQAIGSGNLQRLLTRGQGAWRP